MSSQVPYLEEYIKEPYVFTIDMSDAKKLRKILTHIKTNKVRWKEENFGIYLKLSLEWESLYKVIVLYTIHYVIYVRAVHLKRRQFSDIKQR